MPHKVLVVDDEERMRALLALHLRRDFHVETAASGEEALAKLASAPFDLVLLDILMPGMDGWETCRRIRSEWEIPVLMLTALTDVEDKLEAFDAGADDYVTKPFDPRELVARVHALIRRSKEGAGKGEAPGGEAPIRLAGLSIDPSSRTAEVAGRALSLTPKEFDLLLHLARHPGKAFSREEILRRVWGDAAYAETRTVDSHVKTLREKLGRDGPGRALVTVWGIGYKWDPGALG